MAFAPSYRYKFFSRLAFLVALFFLVSVPDAFAATLDFSPASASYSVGQTFPVRVRVSSSDQSLNAVSGTISFPSNLLEVTSLSKADSIVSLWVQEPSYSNSNGTVNFEGIVLNPGFTGSAGRVITVTFRVKAQGQAALTLVSSSVLANDGKGTNILSTTGGAQFTFGGNAAAPAEVPSAPVAPSEQGPVVTSATHPDQSKWYQVKNADLAWSLPDDVGALRLLLDKFPRSTPTIGYEEPFASKRIENIDDGLWYFHIRFRKGNTWGPVTHYRLQVDGEKPRFFDLSESPRQDPTEPRVTLAVASADDVSGIDRYEFRLDSGDAPVDVWKDDGTSRYTMKPLPPGKHLIFAKVFDRAGNWLANSVEFAIEGLAVPIITSSPSQVEEREAFTVAGTSNYPGATVKLVFRSGAVAHTVEGGKTNGQGTFLVSVEGGTIPRGSYKMEAIIIDGRGAQSYPSEAVKIGVVQNVLFRFGNFAVTFLTLIIPIIALLFALISLIWYGWHRFLQFKKRLQKEVREAEASLHKTFDTLREDIREQVKLLEHVRSKRELTREEERIIKTFRRHLDEAEEYVQKEIKDIEDIRIKFK